MSNHVKVYSTLHQCIAYKGVKHPSTGKMVDVVIRGKSKYYQDRKIITDAPAETIIEKSLWDTIYGARKDVDAVLKAGRVYVESNLSNAKDKAKDVKNNTLSLDPKEDKSKKLLDK